jgi:hypothetical protein
MQQGRRGRSLTQAQTDAYKRRGSKRRGSKTTRACPAKRTADPLNPQKLDRQTPRKSAKPNSLGSYPYSYRERRCVPPDPTRPDPTNGRIDNPSY